MAFTPSSSRTPTLAAVLTAGNETTGIDIFGELGSADNARLSLGTGALASAALAGKSGAAGAAGGNATLTGGAADNFGKNGAEAQALRATVAAHGRLKLITDNSSGAAGRALCPDGSGALLWAGVPSAAGVPAGAPNGTPPFAYDTTAVTGGFYFWNGAAWVKIATIL